jgi:hypothetical protein
MTRSIWFVALATLALDAGAAADGSGDVAGEAKDAVVVYPSSYFAQFQPKTALDLVNQVPAFELDDGSDTRGFGAAAGNILINGRRLTAKQDKPSATLSRIPASLVAEVELIRGQVRGIDLVGQSAIVNVKLVDDLPASVYWELLERYNLDIPPVTHIGTIALTDNWRGIDYNAGAFLRIYSNGDPGTEDVFDGDGNLTEQRYEPQKDTGIETRGNLNASKWFGRTLVALNTNFIFVDEESLRPSYRISVPDGIGNDVLIEDDFTTFDFEMGFDAERQLREELIAKGILLYFRGEKDSLKSQQNLDDAGARTLLKLADTDTVAEESIARVELHWSAIADHAIQFNIEAALNVLDGSLEQTQDDGSGPVDVVVPGANTRVEERRGNLLLKDT